MSKNINNFFNGALLSHKGFLDTLIPIYIKSITSDFVPESKTIEDLESLNISFIELNTSSGDLNSSNSSDIEIPAKVVIINFIGPVVKYEDWWYDMLGTQDYMRILDRFKNDPTVAGVVMNTDSGGGQYYGTPEFYDYIKKFNEIKPIGIYTNGYLCSGAYYFAAPASFIMANKRADAIGSIGIYTEIFDWNGYYESIGLKVHTIYSDLSPEKNKSVRDVLDGKDKNYSNYRKTELNPDGQKFIDDIKSARSQVNEECFKGGVWSGEDAIKMGLVDFNGTMDDAVNKIIELSQSKKYSNLNNNSKTTLQTMSKTTKSFPLIQGIIGIEGEGIPTTSITSFTGVKISEEQLEAVETQISTLNEAVTTAKGKVTTAEGKVTALEGVVTVALEAAGLTAEVEANATTEDKINLLSAKVVEYGKNPGAETTKPESKGDMVEEDAEGSSTSIFESITK